MFPAAYFAPRYFAPRYFPKGVNFTSLGAGDLMMMRIGGCVLLGLLCR